MGINGSTNWTGQSANNTSLASATRLGVKVQLRVDFCRAFTNSTAGIWQIATTSNTNVKACLFATVDNAGNISFTLQIPAVGGISTTASAISAFPGNGADIEIYGDLDGIGNAQHLIVSDHAGTVLQTNTLAQNLGGLITGTSGAVLFNDTNPSALSVASFIVGFGAYNVLLTGSAVWTAPASGDSGIVQMNKFIDATSGTSPNPSVATVGQNITMSGTWAYLNDNAAGTWFGTVTPPSPPPRQPIVASRAALSRAFNW
jgi:hypothetical protein